MRPASLSITCRYSHTHSTQPAGMFAIRTFLELASFTPPAPCSVPSYSFARPHAQAGMEASSAKTVFPEAEVTFHWPSSRCKQLLQVRVGREGDSSLWCTPFGIPTGENFVVKVRRPARDQWEYLHVEVKLVEPVVFVVFREGRTEHAPVMVQNHLHDEAAIVQKGVKHNADRVKPEQVLPPRSIAQRTDWFGNSVETHHAATALVPTKST